MEEAKVMEAKVMEAKVAREARETREAKGKVATRHSSRRRTRAICDRVAVVECEWGGTGPMPTPATFARAAALTLSVYHFFENKIYRVYVYNGN